MSCNYADGLSDYHDKGVCGLPEQYDNVDDIEKKINVLEQWIKNCCHVVVHTGAGISTAAGIPDFRGPRGVWTLEQNGEKPQINISFDEAVPTVTHMALVALANAGYVHCIISQNVDGLHLRSGLSAEKLAELHGNMFLDKCDKCKRLFVRNTASKTVGQKHTGQLCPLPKSNKRQCRGMLRDTILDWEDELPERDLEMADQHSRKGDLSICLGSTLQIVPSGNLPLLTKRNGGKVVICNLQPTKHDKCADLIIHDYVDHIMQKLCKMLEVEIPKYSAANDPTKFNTPLLYYTPTMKTDRPPAKKAKKSNPQFDNITKTEHNLEDKHSNHAISGSALHYEVITSEHKPEDEHLRTIVGMEELYSNQKVSSKNAFHSGIIISQCSSEGNSADHMLSVKKEFHSEKETDVFNSGMIISQSIS